MVTKIARTRAGAESVLYELSIVGSVYRAIETAGRPIALYDAISFPDELLGLMDGIDMLYDDEFAGALEAIRRADGAVSDVVALEHIPSAGIRDYFTAIVKSSEG